MEAGRVRGFVLGINGLAERGGQWVYHVCEREADRSVREEGSE